MTTEKLSWKFTECRTLFQNTPRTDKCFTEAVKYFHDRVFYTDNGLVYFYENGILKDLPREEFEKTFMSGFLDAKLIKEIKANAPEHYKMVLQDGDFTIDKKKGVVNGLKPMFAPTLKDVKVGKNGLEYVEHFKKYVNEVLAGGNKKVFDIIMKFGARTVRRQKCTIAFVVVGSTEGSGKTSFAKILEKLVGTENTCCPSEKSLLQFNFEAYGKVLLLFEETEGVKDKRTFDILKNMTTNDRVQFEQKYQAAGTLQNVSNIFISSNFPVPFSGRRAFQIVPTGKWFRQADLFKKLHSTDNECVKALYDYFMSIDVSNWNDAEQQEDVYELNSAGNLKEIEKMSNAWKFLKDNFALSRKIARIKKSELYTMYVDEYGQKAMKASTFYDKVKELDVELKKNNVDTYYIDGEQLLAQFQIRNLICAEDLEGKNKNDVHVIKDDALLKENIDLKKQIAELQEQLKKLGGQVETKPDEVVTEEKAEPIKKKIVKKVVQVKKVELEEEEPIEQIEPIEPIEPVEPVEPETVKIFKMKVRKSVN